MPKQPTPTTFAVECLGMSLSGTAVFYPGREGRTSGPPEKCYPSEPAEVDIHTLTCGGKDAMFLLDSNLSKDLLDAIEDTFNVEPDDSYEEPWEDDEEELP